MVWAKGTRPRSELFFLSIEDGTVYNSIRKDVTHKCLRLTKSRLLLAIEDWPRTDYRISKVQCLFICHCRIIEGHHGLIKEP